MIDIRAGRIGREEALESFKALGVKPKRVAGASTDAAYSQVYSHGEDLLKDHILLGEQFLMGVAHWSLALQGLASRSAGSRLCLTEAVFVDAVKVDPGTSARIDLHLREDRRGPVFETRYAKTPGDRVIAARGRVVDHADAGFFDRPVDPKTWIAGALESADGDRFYADPEQSCYGPSLRSVRSVHRLADSVLAEIELTPAMQQEASTWFCHPAWLDALHVTCAFSAGWEDPVGHDWVPFAAKAVRVGGSLAGLVGQRMYARVSLEKETAETKKFNCALYAGSGQPLIELQGFSTKRVPSREALLGQNLGTRPVQAATTVRQVSSQKARPPLQTRISDYLVQKAAVTLAVPLSEIHTQRNFMEMGLDSVAITRLSEAIGTEIGIEILPTAFFENQNIEELSEYLADEFPDEFSRHFGHQNTATLDQPSRQQAAYRAGRDVDPSPALSPESQDIAIIGMDGRLAGSPNLNRFWQHLRDGSDLMREVPLSHWDYRPWFDAERTAENKTYCKWGSFLDDIDCFDPQFFGIAPSQAKWMDPQLRMLLEVVYGTIEDAGCASSIRGSRTGVYTGVCFREYWDEIVRKRVPLKSGFEAYSSGLSTLATVISYTFDLQAASIPIDNACASSLTALHLACQSLQSGECDQAFVAGINLLLSPLHYVFFSRIQALSPTGRCHTFDKRADGYTPGEGIVAVLLKPLDKAIADGDQVHAVIKGTAVNHAGRSNNPTSPRPELQTRLVLDSWDKAGIDPETISYLECHGTGTELGDPIEINALKKAFARHTDKRNFCAIGSAKAHIGHLEGAAGLAGLIKVVLSMKHRSIPRMPGFEELNPVIRIDNSPFYINRATQDWDDGGQTPLRAGVSSFGIGGNNAHVVLEEYRAAPSANPDDRAERVQRVAVPLSARTPDRLQAVAQRLRDFIREHPQTELADLAFTLQTGREAMEERLGFVVGSLSELERGLSDYLAGAEPACHRAKVGENRQVLADLLAPLGAESTVAKLLEVGEPEALLEWWSKGLELDWNALCNAERPSLISLPTYPFARESYWMPEQEEAPLPPSMPAEPSAPTEFTEDSAYYPIWEPAPSEAPEPGRTAQTLLILHGESTFGFDDALAAEHPGARIVRIRLAAGPTGSVAEDRWQCHPDDPNGLQTCLADLQHIDRVFFLALDLVEASDLAQRLAGLAPVEVQLARLAGLLRRRLSASASLDLFVLGLDCWRLDGAACNPYAAGVNGLAYSIAQSEHRFRLRNADLSRDDLQSPESQSELAQQLIAQPPSDRGELSKFWARRRFRQVFVPLDWREALPESGLRRGGVYLLLGGSGAVGGLISRYLIERYDAQVVWLGRRPADDAQLRKKLEALDRKPLYVQADATDPGSLHKALKEVRGTHAEIHGAIYLALPDRAVGSLFEIPESEFLETLRVKTLGSLNFYQALRGLPLDFLCYFSSAQAFAFSGAARLSAYASGIGFCDALVRYLNATSAFPVGTINWGLWQSTPAGDMASQSEMAGLGDAEGSACFDRFIGLLTRNRLHQAICMKLSAPVREMMQPQEQDSILPAQALSAVPTESLWVSDAVSAAQLEAVMEQGALGDFEDQLVKLLWVELQTMGALPGTAPADPETLRRNAGILDKFLPWWQECLRVLEQAGYLRFDQGRASRVVGQDIGTTEAVWRSWDQRKQDYLGNRDLRTAVSLADDCLRLLPQILCGEKLVTDVLFPDGSMSRIEGLYKDNVRSDYYNAVMAEVLVAYVRQRLSSDPEAKLRILEIGAGTGGTTSRVLPGLSAYQDQIHEYCFTDVSQAFLHNAWQQYAADYPFLTTRLWDVESLPAEQGIAPGSYDVVLATNVLHATRSIRNTLRNTKAALAGNGLLLLNEISRKEVFQSLVFGLIDGWSLSEDEELRIQGSPGLYPDTWQRLLEETGFHSVSFPVASTHEYGNQIILANSDGLIRQPRPESVHPAAESEGSAHSAPQDSAREVHRLVAAPPTPSVMPGADERIQRLVLSSLAQVLSVSEDSIQTDVAFSDYGVDSILGVKFINAIGEGLGQSINTAILFDYSSVERLSSYLAETYGAETYGAETCGTSQAVLASDTVEENAPAPVQPAQSAAAPPPKPKPAGHSTDIAVIGLSGQFPEAEDTEAFWDNLVAGKCSIGELSEPYVDQQAMFHPRRQRGKTYCKWGGALSWRDCFDPRFFNITPAEAESMSPHQRLVLLEAWRSLEDAGYNPRRLAGSRTGIYVGAEPTRYVHESFTGASDAIVASRLSYYLDLQGPAFVVNTGCSSSGVALHLACESLRHGESDLMLAGGVYASLDQEGLVSLSQAGMLSASGRCSPFDANADGTLLAEAVGMVVLKRLDDALRDEDPIYGVIQASGLNQDGASNGITAPSGAAQERLIKAVHEKYRIDPDTITYVEAHGTGTELGDPVEANALVRAFGGVGERRAHCAVGTAKANIGHAAAASGVVGLIKILLSMKHRSLPGLVGFERLNPRIEFDKSAFYPLRENSPWQPRDGLPRIAALNAFGHSGTNVHLVVREHVNPPTARSHGTVLVPLSARTPDSLKRGVEKLLRWIERSAQADFPLRDLAYTLQLGRDAMRHRFVVLCEDKASLVSGLRHFLTEGAGLHGQAEDKQSTLLFDSEEDTRELVAKWTAQGKLNKIASCWVQGIPVDWSALYGADRPRRIHLPAYAFAQERYWGPGRSSQGKSGDTGRNEQVEDQVDSGDAPASLLFEEYWGPYQSTEEGKTSLRCLVCLLADPAWRSQFADALQQWHPAVELTFVSNELGLGDVLQNADAVVDLRALAEPEHLRKQTRIQEIIKAIAAGPQRPRRLLIAASTADELQRCYLDAWIGMARSLPLVLPQLQVALIGRDAATSMAVWMRSVLGALSATPYESWLYQGDTPTVCRLRPVTLDAGESVVKTAGSYLITGGCGGLGYRIAQHLVRNYAARVALLGRSPADARIESQLQTLRAMGGQACYVQADVCDDGQLRAALDQARESIGEFHGLVHAAGVQGSETILEKDPTDFRAVLDTKIKGTLLLDEMSQSDPLDWVCYFSSSAAILGDFGACDYAVGNRFQNAYARVRNARQARGLCSGRAVVINWPLWRADGMQVDQSDLYLRSSGQQALDIATGVALFDRLIAQPRAQHMVLNGIPERIHGFLQRQGLVEAAAAPEAAVEQPVADITRRVLEDLREAVVGLLKISRDELVADTNLADFGFDSISLTDFARELSERYDIEITPSVFFAYSTLNDLSRHLLADHDEALRRHFASPAPWAQQPPRPVSLRLMQSAQQVQTEAPSLAEPIAIIGISGRFPEARDADAMWTVLEEGRLAVKEIPAERFDWRSIYGEGPGKSNSRWCGSVPGVAEFDPLFFEIAPRDAQLLDPRQRLLMQEAWNALENAGYGPARLARSTVGSFVGVEEGDYQRVAAEEDIASNHTAVLASRLAYFLNLRGLTLAINTACSSALVAVHQACMSLRHGECDTALAAGVNLLLAPDIYLAMAKAGMLSDDGKCFAFDRRANGMVPGEAVAVVVLKSLSRALADGDPIHALIRGSRINYDGKTNGITAPSGLSQAELIKDVYRQIGIDPGAVEYIVTHGTGTRLGDSVEINALNDAFKASTSKQAYCALTSTKSNFGHSFAASGLVSLIALVQSLRHETIPASLNCEQENDFIRWRESPFFVNKQNRPWPARTGEARIGGVSAFGMSGTNAHVVVSDHGGVDTEAAESRQPGYLLVLSAKTEEALEARVERMRTFMADSDVSLPAVAFTLLEGRHHFRHRLAVVAESREQVLQAWESTAPGQPLPRIGRGQVPVDFSPDEGLHTQGLELIRSCASLGEQPQRYLEVLTRLGELFCQGYELPWADLFGARPPRRVCLPGYPFSRQTYWSRSTSARAGTSAFLPPLLHRNGSDFSGQRFSSRFSGDEACLRDHQVGGRRILPAVAYLEMARAAIQEAAPKATIRLRRVVWLQALAVLDVPTEVQLSLSEQAPGQIRFEFSDAEDRVYCRGEAELSETLEQPRLDIAALRTACQDEPIGAERFYASFRAMGIEYGPAHQGLELAYLGDSQVLARLSLPPEFVTGDVDLNPGIMDSGLQAAIALRLGPAAAWPGDAGTQHSDLSPPIPFALESLDALGSSPAVCWVWIRPAEGEAMDESSQKLDIDYCDDHGAVFASLRGLSTRSLQTRDAGKATRFSGREFYLEDHGGMLPGVIHLELARAAAGRDVYGLHEVSWRRPIWVGGAGLELRTLLGQRDGRHSFEIRVRDDVHAQGLLSFEPGEAPASLSLLPIRKRCNRHLGREACEQRLDGLHGPRLFSVRELRYSDNEALALLERPSTEKHGFQCDPAMLNGALLTSVIFSLVSNPEASPPFPCSVDRVDYFGPLPERAYAYLRPSAHDRDRAVNRHDIDLVDEQGRVAIRFAGLATVSGEARSEMLYACPVWRTEPLPESITAQTTDDPLFMLAAEDPGLESRLREHWPAAGVERLPVVGEHRAKAIQDNFVAVYRWLQTHLQASETLGRPLVLLLADEDADLDHSAYSGLFLTARLEAPGRVLKIVRHRPDPALLEDVQAELCVSDGPLEVRYTAPGQRRIRVFREIDLDATVDGPALAGRVVWITGGLGGLGWEFARHLGTQMRMKIALSGRSPLDGPRQARLDALSELGVELTYFQGDVSQESDVRGMVAAIEQRFGGLNGIIHAAGVVRDALIRDKDLDQVGPVLLPKVSGALLVDAATRDCDLDFMVLCGSLTGVLGNPGQADYAGANAFLDAFAADRNRRVSQGMGRGRTIALDWPLWRAGGMGMSPEQERVLKQTTGMTAMPTAQGMQALERALRHDQDQILVAHGDRKAILNRLLAAASTPAKTPQKLIRLATERVQRELIKTVAELQMVDPKQIELDSELSVYGFDSIRFAELAGRLNEAYDLSLMPTVFFEHRTLRALSGHLAANHGEAFSVPARLASQAAPESKPAEVVSLPLRQRSAGPVDRARAPDSLAQPITDPEPIAVVGMSGRLPGSADLEAFWRHLEANADLITEVPKQRWDWRSFYGDPHDEPGKTRAKWGGFIDDVDCFDAMFFGISPNEAQSMDPQSRLFLETAWAAIEDAGYPASALSGSRTGLFAGVSTTDYRDLAQQAAIAEGLVADRSTYAFMLANRVSNFLDIHGPSEAIDTACSSSLVAIHRAVESMRQGNCDAALAGGVNLIANPQVMVTASRAGMLSEDGRCKTFDRRANGYVRGEGVGVVLLKPLGRALADGDRIHGLIRGSAENHGGRASSPSAPNPVAQKVLLVDAYSRAGIDPDTVSYMEAHGTGTELGDPIELNGLNAAFGELYERAGLSMSRSSCALGSVKANIGHLEAAAGISGVLKILLMLRHHKIPGNPHLQEPNPYLQLDEGPFYLAQETQIWEASAPRRAGISSFGIGGANAHLILEEYPGEDSDARHLAVDFRSPALVVLSARTPERLEVMAANLREFLRVSPDIHLSELAFTLQVGRERMEERLAFLADSLNDLCSLLDSFLNGESDTDHIFRGKVQREDGPLGLDRLDEDLAQVIDSWWAKGKYAELLKLWVKGLAFDWRVIYGETPPARISLPGYPFARDRYWLQAGGRRPANAVPAGPPRLHPLLHANTSTLSEQRFSTELDREMFCLRDHQVRGQRLLPGMVYLEMARAAMQMSLDDRDSQALSVRISHFGWAQALAVDDAPKRVHVSLLEEAGTGLQCEIYTVQDTERYIHARGAVALVSPPPSETLDLQALRSRCSRARIDADACYAGFKDGGIDYGPGHRAIQMLQVGEGEALARLALPESLNGSEADYVLHPSMMDAALQSAAALMFGSDAAPTASPFLPYALESLEIHGPCVAAMWSWVRDSAVDPGGALRKLDIDLCDDQGVLCVRLKGFSSRPLESAKTAETADNQLLLSQPLWRPLPPTPAAAESAVAEHLVLLCALEQWAPVDVEAQWIGVSCSRVESRYEAMHERFEDLAAQVFESVQQALQGDLDSPVFVQLVVPSRGPMRVLRALAGLLKTAHREHGRLTGQLVEVDPELTPETLVEALKVAAGYPKAAQLRFSADGQGETETWKVLPHTTPGVMPWKQGGVYLITGGAGALGLIFAEEIRSRVDDARLILVGRSELGATQQARIEALGGRVDYRRADLSQGPQVDALIASVSEEFGAINGILHAAGTSQDAFILKKSSEDFAKVLAPKVSGAVNLDHASQDMALDFFLLFSSGAGVLGNPGQSDYATANAFLDAFAEYRNQLVEAGERRGLALSIAWPLWEEGGMAVDEATRQMLWNNHGLAAVRTQDGIAAFYRVLDAGLPRVLVAQGDVQRLRADDGKAQARPQSWVQAVEPAAGKSRSAGATDEQTLDLVRKALSGAIKMPEQDIETDVAFEKYGLDSMLQMGVIRDLEKVTGELPKTLLFEYASAAELTAYLLQHHGEALSSHFHEASPESPATPAVDEAPLRAGPPASRRKTWATRGTQRQPSAGTSGEDIAIIGIAGRYPGADSLEALWERLRAGDSCISEADWRRWRNSVGRGLSAAGAEGERARFYGGFLEQIDRFDYALFDLPRSQVLELPNELRLFLEIAWETFEDAGYSQQGLNRLQQDAEQGIGLFVGAMYSQYAWTLPSFEEAVLNSNSSDWQIANRVSHFFNLTGPSIAVNSACSSSLTAIHLACESLNQKSCPMALAGGVNLTLDPSKFEALSNANILGSGSVSRSLGDGDGYLPGEGVGAVLLKPLSAALRDRDRIHALIKSSYINHGGGRQVYTAPDPNQIAALMRQSIRRSDLDPETIGYIESAVNGSELGDPIEVRALKKAFSECTRRRPLGSVKSNLGHLEAASGMSQLSKVLLQMRHRTLVPSINARPLNPHVNLDDSPFFVQEETADWVAQRDEHNGAELPRRSMINSLGVGGAYANLIVEEFIAPDAAPRQADGASLLVFSANTREQLRKILENMRDFVAAQPGLEPHRLAHSLHRLNHQLPFRAALLVGTREELSEALEQLLGEDDPASRLLVAGLSEPAAALPSAGELEDGELATLARQWVAGKRADFSTWYRVDAAPWMPIPRYPFDHREALDFGAPEAPPPAPDQDNDFAWRLMDQVREGGISETQFKAMMFSSLGES